MVSVIIPIHNVEKYIDRGLTNILKQTYQDYEVILVDDGSTDGSPTLCNAWAERYGKIRVLHKENGGAGSARNLGIENAQGEYIYFFDIDDLADENLLSYCVQTMDASGADMMVFSFRNKDVTSKQEYDIVMDDIDICCNSELRDVFVDQFVMKINGFPWNKMYRRSFLNEHHLRFEDLLIQQDEVFNLSIYPHVTKMIISSEILYTYFIYHKGNTRTRFIPNRFDIYRTVNDRFRALKEHWQIEDERLERYMHRRLLNTTISGFLSDLRNERCTWTTEEKENVIAIIADDNRIKESIRYLYSSISLENRLYIKAIQRKSVTRLLRTRAFFGGLRKIIKGQGTGT